MPSRPFSAAIIGGLWPTTSPDTWSDVGDGLAQKANALDGNAATIRQLADGLPAENSGKAIDAMHEMCLRQAIAVVKHADIYHSMARAVSEIARVIYSARSKLDEIDANGNAEIERIRHQFAHLGGYVMAMQMINEVIAQARALAVAESSRAATEITSLAAFIGSASPTAPTSGQPPLDPKQFQRFGAGGPGPGLHGFLGNLPQSGGPDSSPLPQRPSSDDAFGHQPQPPAPAASGDSSASPGNPIDDAKKNAAKGNQRFPSVDQAFGWDDPDPSTPSGMPPVMPTSLATPSSGPGGGVPFSPGLSSPSLPSPSSLGMGEMPPLSGPGLGGSPPAITPPAPTGGAPPPATTGADFARGLNAGLNASPVLPPPVAQPPPSASGAPSGTPAAAPPLVTPPAPTSMPATSGTPIGAPMFAPPPTSASGPLPPFGSDVTPRQVAPAAGGTPTAPAAPAPPPAAATAAVAPLPPGVAGSGVGGAAAGAYAGMKSNNPDPLLQTASQLVYQLMHASLVYGCVDWCVGIFKTGYGIDTVIVSNEGAGYIPPGVFVPRSTRNLFSDNGLTAAFRARWFGWVNPAQTMLAYSSLIGEYDPNLELYALAVSTDHGGSALPARDAGVPHYEDCSLLTSPIRSEAEPMPLDEMHVHRLQTVDAAEYARLVQMTVPEAQQRDASWATTREAVQTALSRASGLLGLEVPPVIRHVLTALDRREPVSDEQWDELEFARFNATLDSASQRAGRRADEMISPHTRACHNLARVAELLRMWRHGPNYCDIAYEAGQIAIEARLWPSNEA
jgi:hypothetical protein